jgi:hypothetical protein
VAIALAAKQRAMNNSYCLCGAKNSGSASLSENDPQNERSGVSFVALSILEPQTAHH